MKFPVVTKRRKGESSEQNADALPGTTRKAIEHFIHVLARCGTQPDDIVAAVEAECRRIPRRWIKRALTATQEREDAGKLLTAWHTNPLTLHSSGAPKWLPVRGDISIEMLLSSVSEHSDASEVIEYLRGLGFMRRKGRLYAPRDRYLALEKARRAKRVNGTDYFRTLRMLCHMLATLEHNVLPNVVPRLEAFAENYRVPVSAIPAFDAELRRHNKGLMEWVDVELRRLELRRKAKEPTQGVGVGVYAAEYAGPETRPRPIVGIRGRKQTSAKPMRKRR